MDSKIVRARFLGREVHSNYRRGRAYTLVIEHDVPYANMKDKVFAVWHTTVRRKMPFNIVAGFTPYASSEEFNRDWFIL